MYVKYIALRTFFVDTLRRNQAKSALKTPDRGTVYVHVVFTVLR
jgi:hypothetical protein